MTAASPVDVCISVARQIAESRRLPRWQDCESRVRHSLLAGTSICLVVQSAHAECVRKCGRAVPIEMWTLELRNSHSEEQGGVDAFFLSSAVRSQLHFSPLQSWLSRGGLPAGVTLSTTIEPVFSVQHLFTALPEEHRFPESKAQRCTLCGERPVCALCGSPLSPPTVPNRADCRQLGDVSFVQKVHTISPSSSPIGSPLDAPVFPDLGLQGLSLQCDALAVAFQTPPYPTKAPPLSLAPSKAAAQHQNSGERKNRAPVPRPRTLPLLSPTGVSRPKLPKLDQSENGRSASIPRRILFADSNTTVSPQPLPSPFKGLLDDVEHDVEKKHSQPGQLTSASTICTTRDQKRVGRSGGRCALFNRIGLPVHSSPAPPLVPHRRALRKSLCVDLPDQEQVNEKTSGRLAISAPSRSLLGSFEESALHGRLDPLAEVHGFTAKLSACCGAVPHFELTLPMRAYFFDSGDDAAPSPNLGICSLEALGRRGAVIPLIGTLQMTLFNPQGTVVRMFVQKYDFADMPPRSQTFLRQRTFFMREKSPAEAPRWLRYLVHFKIRTDKNGRVRLHGDIRVLFAPNSSIDAVNLESPGGSDYALHSFTEMPRAPKYSPVK